MTVQAFSSAKRYIGFAVQSAIGTPASAPSVFLPLERSTAKFKNELNVTEERDTTGDYFILVDGIPTQPHTSGVLACPFRPTILNTLLAACCLPGGAMVPPVPLTVFQGSGFDEDIFSDMFFAGGDISVAQNQAARINFNFLGLEKSVPHAVRTATLPAYERAYRLGNLGPATMGADTVNRFDSLTIKIVSNIQLYYGSRGDGSSYPSDAILEELGASVDLVRAYNSATHKTTFLNECGVPVSIVLPFSTNCGTAHSHTFNFPVALYTAEELDAADNAPITEMLTFLALRGPGVTPSPMTVDIV